MVDLRGVAPQLLNGPFVSVRTFMGAFGKGIAKPTELYASGQWVALLARELPSGFTPDPTLAPVKRTRGKAGKISVNGQRLKQNIKNHREDEKTGK